jgi:hypothetical protein
MGSASSSSGRSPALACGSSSDALAWLSSNPTRDSFWFKKIVAMAAGGGAHAKSQGASLVKEASHVKEQ